MLSLALPALEAQPVKLDSSPKHTAWMEACRIKSSFITTETTQSHLMFQLLDFALSNLHSAYIMLKTSDQLVPFHQRLYMPPHASQMSEPFIAPLTEEVPAMEAFLADLMNEAHSMMQRVSNEGCHTWLLTAIERDLYYIAVVSYESNQGQEHLVLSCLKKKYDYLNDLVKTLVRTLYQNMG